MFDFKNIPPVVKNLLIINVLFYIGSIILLQTQGIDLADYLGLYYFQSDGFRPDQLITYMFMHAIINPQTGSIVLMHILGNMFALFMFGRVLEQVWGGKRFLIYYMATGIGAGLVQLLVAFIRLIPITNSLSFEEMNFVLEKGFELSQHGGSSIFLNNPLVIDAIKIINTPTIGASGAVFGILLAFGMLFPNTELMLLFPPIPIKAKWFVLFYGAFELYSGFANNPNDNVAHFAHLGGMLFGFILIKMWKKDRGHFY